MRFFDVSIDRLMFSKIRNIHIENRNIETDEQTIETDECNQTGQNDIQILYLV